MCAAVAVRTEIVALMVEHARRDAREECCGVLAGRDGVISRAFGATNAAANRATGYDIAPQELFRLMREIRAAGLELLGIYHSHPASENRPSPRDIELAYYPDAAYFIVSPAIGAARPVRAFRINEGKVSELEIEIVG
jgi:[CysO sulfur-carrier protein]-S-L-cysteine hydrolase